MGFIKTKTIIILTPLFFILIMSSGCAFGDRQVLLTPIYSENLPFEKVKASPVYITSTKDARGDHQAPNFVGYVRNGFDIHTANVLGDKDVDKWVQSCLVENLKKSGFKVYDGKSTTKGLCLSAVINILECNISYTVTATIVINAKLKENDKEFFSQSFTGKFSKPAMSGSANEYQEVLDRAMKLCLDEMMLALIYHLKKK